MTRHRIFWRARATVPEHVRMVNAWAAAFSPRPPEDFLDALCGFMQRGLAQGWASTTQQFATCSPVLAGATVSITDPTVTLNTFGTLTHAPYYGITGDAATGYFQRPIAANAETCWTADNCSIGVWSQSGLVDNGSGGASSSGARLGLALFNDVSRFQIWPNSGTTSLTANVRAAQGGFAWSRQTLAGGFHGYAGVTTNWTSAGSASLPTGNVRFFRFVNEFSQNELAFLYYGQMTADQYTGWSIACLELLLTLDSVRDGPQPEIIGNNCFNITEPSATPARQFRLARRPTSNSEDLTTYPFGPVTDVHGELADAVLTSTDTRVKFWPHIWSNRAHTDDKKANGVDGGIRVTVAGSSYDGRMDYSTITKATGATLVTLAYSLALNARDDVRLTLFQGTTRSPGWGWLDIADAYGYDTSGWAPYLSDPTTLYTDVTTDTGGVVAHGAYFAANAAAIFTTPFNGAYTATDRISLPHHRITELDASVRGGGWLDTEERDGRTNVDESNLMLGASQIGAALGYYIVMSTNRKDQSITSGWDPTTCAYLMTLPNVLTNIVIARTDTDSVASITAQYNMFKGPSGLGAVDGTKLIMHAILGPSGIETPIAYIQAGRAVLVANSIGSTHVTPSYAIEGGTLNRAVNQIIATLDGLPTS